MAMCLASVLSTVMCLDVGLPAAICLAIIMPMAMRLAIVLPMDMRLAVILTWPNLADNTSPDLCTASAANDPALLPIRRQRSHNP